jgi:hypothetical protein
MDNEGYKIYLIMKLLFTERMQEKPKDIHELGISSHFYGL